MGRGILRGAGGDENLKFNFIWPNCCKVIPFLKILSQLPTKTNIHICINLLKFLLKKVYMHVHGKVATLHVPYWYIHRVGMYSTYKYIVYFHYFIVYLQQALSLSTRSYVSLTEWPAYTWPKAQKTPLVERSHDEATASDSGHHLSHLLLQISTNTKKENNFFWYQIP